MNATIKILGCGIVIIIVNILYFKYLLTRKEKRLYSCRNGDYKGQTHEIKDWRKIAIELAKTTKNSRLNAMAKYGTDEDIIGLLYINFGIELFDETSE